MSAGPSLYRRHRPRTFAEVVGQEHVVRTLTNAVAGDRVHHAYLFVGSRGTGKTSMAKILAACLNCVDGPTVEPCGVCDSCVSIASASSLDVIEMDAASSNSVDDIRALRDSVAYAPVSGRQKIYILDEAHMLSTAAWNAFLKTLEEPPPNTVFVLATTEAQKVLPTVVDRCHRFDFQRPTAEQIATVLARTAAAEQIAVGPEAIAVLARHASGSFRDALGTLEQLQTYAGAQIELADVLAVLGISDVELLFGALDAVARADPRQALRAAAAAVDGGHDPAAFVRELETHVRELLVVQLQDGVVPPELSLTPERDERLAAQAQALSTTALVRTLDLLADALVHIRSAADARTQLELALVKASRPDLDPTLTAISARLERLEHGATTLEALAAPAATPQQPGRIEASAPPRPPADQGSAAPPQADRIDATAAPQPPASEDTPTSPQADRTDATAAPHSAAGQDTATATPPQPEGRVATAAPQMPSGQDTATPSPAISSSAPSATADEQMDADAGKLPKDPEPAQPAAGVLPAGRLPKDPEPAQPAAGVLPAGKLPKDPEPAQPAAGRLSFEHLISVWPDVLDTVRASNAMFGAVVDVASPVELAGDRLVLAFAEDAAFQRRKAEERATRTALADAVRAVTGHALTFSYEVREGHAPPPPQPLSEDELIERLKDEFDAEELRDTEDEQEVND